MPIHTLENTLRVRIKSSTPGEADSIQFDEGLDPKIGRLRHFFHLRDYRLLDLGIDNKGASTIEVRPPMKPEDIERVGTWCVNGVLDGVPVGLPFNPVEGDIVVLDATRQGWQPETAVDLSGARIVATSKPL